MQQISLIPSFEKVELHSSDLVAKDVISSVSQEIQQIKTLANPLTCDSKYLPFLAYAFKVDFWDDRLDIEAKRALIQESILLHKRKGTLWAIERVLEILNVKANVFEWYKYGGEPYYFKVKLELQQQFPNINQLAKLIDVYKNVRSKYEIDFDLFLNTFFSLRTGTNTSIDISESLKFEFNSIINTNFGSNFNYDPHDIFKVEKSFSFATTASSISDIEFEEKEFNVNRNTFIDPVVGLIARLDFGYTDSDVMHLPIPPIQLKTKIKNSAISIFDMNFSNIDDSLFHLTYMKEYIARSDVKSSFSSIFEIDLNNSGINLEVNVETSFDNTIKTNLNF